MVIEFDFAWLDIQGRGAKGSTLTAHKVDRVVNAPKENGEDETNGSPDEPVPRKKLHPSRRDRPLIKRKYKRNLQYLNPKKAKSSLYLNQKMVNLRQLLNFDFSFHPDQDAQSCLSVSSRSH